MDPVAAKYIGAGLACFALIGAGLVVLAAVIAALTLGVSASRR